MQLLTTHWPMSDPPFPSPDQPLFWGENGTQSKEVIAISIDTPEFAFQSVPLGLRRVCENVIRLYATSTIGQGAVRVHQSYDKAFKS
ncbi:hypothetical protein HGM15179_010385 [Zosterops borbonicus]|uniref:Uncharacterized protein n=1 Tax=Zosterops borbonicus TaxID=364589 RepID=A0A8K1GEW7_9PASS|nr:hypothetical protein HGM15179_010385 [Zosterops borbonicus]